MPKVDPPVGKERDTRSDSHPSTPALPNHMCVRSSTWCVGGQQRRKSAKCPHNPRERKCGKYRDTCVKRKTTTQPLGHMTRYLCVHTHTCFHTQEISWSYCEKCMLTARSPVRQTRLPETSSKRFGKGRGSCGGGGRHTVKFTPVDTRTAKPHAST